MIVKWITVLFALMMTIFFIFSTWLKYKPLDFVSKNMVCRQAYEQVMNLDDKGKVVQSATGKHYNVNVFMDFREICDIAVMPLDVEGTGFIYIDFAKKHGVSDYFVQIDTARLECKYYIDESTGLEYDYTNSKELDDPNKDEPEKALKDFITIPVKDIFPDIATEYTVEDMMIEYTKAMNGTQTSSKALKVCSKVCLALVFLSGLYMIINKFDMLERKNLILEEQIEDLKDDMIKCKE